MAVLILETSTSAAKAMIVLNNGSVVVDDTSSYARDIGSGGIQQPDLICKSVMNLGAAIVHKYRFSASFKEQIEAIAIVSTWHNSLVIDANGRPRGNAYTWTYRESAPTALEYRRNPDKCADYYRKSGCLVNGSYVSFRVKYLIEQGLSFEVGDVLIDQGSYLYYTLTKERAVSRSMASGTGLFSIETLSWNDELLDEFKIPKRVMPEIVDHMHTAPLRAEAAEWLGVTEGIPVLTAHPDGAMNQVGDDALGTGIMTMSVGTSGALRVTAEDIHMPQTPSAWFYYAPGKPLVGMATSGCTNCVDWFVNDICAGAYTYKHLDQMAELEVENDSNPAIFLPFLFGERAPSWNDSRQGGFVDLQGSHSMAAMYRSVLEGICFNLRQCYEVLTGLCGEPKHIHVSGGIVHSDMWCRMMSNVLGRELLISPVQHASLIGGAKLALAACGSLTDIAMPLTSERRVVAPDEKRVAMYEAIYNRYLSAYEQTGELAK